jgi:hypothetical protein
VPVQRCTVHKHRDLLAHAPDRLHEEVSADYNDMMYTSPSRSCSRHLVKGRSPMYQITALLPLHHRAPEVVGPPQRPSLPQRSVPPAHTERSPRGCRVLLGLSFLRFYQARRDDPYLGGSGRYSVVLQGSSPCSSRRPAKNRQRPCEIHAQIFET